MRFAGAPGAGAPAPPAVGPGGPPRGPPRGPPPAARCSALALRRSLAPRIVRASGRALGVYTRSFRSRRVTVRQVFSWRHQCRLWHRIFSAAYLRRSGPKPSQLDG